MSFIRTGRITLAMALTQYEAHSPVKTGPAERTLQQNIA